MTPRCLLAAGFLLSLVLAALLTVFALDVLRWSDSLAAQDVRFLGAPTAARFTPPPSRLPFGVTEKALGAGDDLAFRRQLQGFARVRPGAEFDAPRLALRTETQVGLAQL